MFPWPLFFVLFAMGVFGAVAVLPYSFALDGVQIQDMPYSRTQFLLSSILQSSILIAVATGLGLLTAQSIGLELPILNALVTGNPVLPLLQEIIVQAVVIGGLAAGIVLLLEITLFRPRMPDSIKNGAHIPEAWQGLLASFYGGITEEIFLRLFLLSGTVWLLSRFTGGVPTEGQFWFGIVFAALLFGIGHLPATARLAPLTPLLVVRGLVLNGLLGIVAGYLFWRYGLETAMIAHFTADIVLHVLPVRFIKQRVKAGG